ncbi:MAG: aminotransferase class I/II-fold pyridoxal phosphate-dependent enzyme [Saprospiraceae bacterium]|nr:aminotransferase class I/II-fold pyridoxal phosphate-dependent enzyme [Saprospiraceae bacterium]
MIPLSIPNISGNEWLYVKDCLDTGWISSVGSYVNTFEEKIAEFTGAKYAVAAMNGTAALHLSMQLAGVKRGDYVIVPDITFIASCNAVSYLGAEPLLIDVDKYTWQMDLDLLESFLEENTSLVASNSDEGIEIVRSHLKTNGKCIGAILPVHVLGNMVDMDRLTAICTKYHIPVVEDSTEALGSTFKGKHAGTFGIFGTSSFNGNKIISTGGGE